MPILPVPSKNSISMARPIGNQQPRGDTFVVPQDATERFMADDLLTFGKWLIFIRPFSGERSIVQPLVWPKFIVPTFPR